SLADGEDVADSNGPMEGEVLFGVEAGGLIGMGLMGGDPRDPGPWTTDIVRIEVVGRHPEGRRGYLRVCGMSHGRILELCGRVADRPRELHDMRGFYHHREHVTHFRLGTFGRHPSENPYPDRVRPMQRRPVNPQLMRSSYGLTLGVSIVVILLG